LPDKQDYDGGGFEASKAPATDDCLVCGMKEAELWLDDDAMKGKDAARQGENGEVCREVL